VLKLLGLTLTCWALGILSITIGLGLLLL